MPTKNSRFCEYELKSSVKANTGQGGGAASNNSGGGGNGGSGIVVIKYVS